MEENKKGCVYFFRHIGLTPVKIGFSTNESPIGRFNSFKTYAPYGSEILGFILTDEAKEIETKLHLKYSNKRLLGEWFEITEDEVKVEVDFYSNIEDIKERNNFQIAWAKKVNEKAEKINEAIKENENNKDIADITAKKQLFNDLYRNKKGNINKTEASISLGVSRVTIYSWIKESDN
jgi:Meiotically up-regulated gene 113